MRISHLLALLLSAAALPAQVSFTNSDWPGVMLQFDARLEPPGLPGSPMIGSVMTGKDRQHRLVSDPGQKRYFGYDFRVEPRGRVLQVRIEPLHLTPQELRDAQVDPSWARLSLPNYPVIPEARLGDTIAIDVLVNPSTGRKVVDYISLLPTTPDPIAVPRDFTASDAVLDFNGLKLFVDGKLVDASASVGGIAGSTVWFYLPGQGRYNLSLFGEAKPAYRKAGQVAGTVLKFTGSGRQYRLESTARIAPGIGAFNVYVSHDAAWMPKGSDAREPFILGASD